MSNGNDENNFKAVKLAARSTTQRNKIANRNFNASARTVAKSSIANLKIMPWHYQCQKEILEEPSALNTTCIYMGRAHQKPSLTTTSLVMRSVPIEQAKHHISETFSVSSVAAQDPMPPKQHSAAKRCWEKALGLAGEQSVASRSESGTNSKPNSL
jgi:hypothetical protein